MPTKIKPTTVNTTDVAYALVQTIARLHAATVADVTNNSGGTAGPLVANAVNLADVAAESFGSNLADKATTEAALATYKDALVELYAKANAMATACGLDTITYNGGGTAADGTIAVVTKTVTGAATGVKAANVNASLAALNEAAYNLVALTNRLCKATGNAGLANAFKGKVVAIVPAISVDGGTAASPGVTKADLDAELTKAANTVATVATKLNAINNGVATAQFVAT